MRLESSASSRIEGIGALDSDIACVEAQPERIARADWAVQAAIGNIAATENDTLARANSPAAGRRCRRTTVPRSGHSTRFNQRLMRRAPGVASRETLHGDNPIQKGRQVAAVAGTLLSV